MHCLQNTDATKFYANVDTFGGNSGSVIYDRATGIAEGILVTGEQDYVSHPDPARDCWIVNTLPDDAGNEGIQRITRASLDAIPLHPALVVASIAGV